MRLHANDRLIPDVDDDGNITDVYMMMNTFTTEKPPLYLIEDTRLIEGHP